VVGGAEHGFLYNNGTLVDLNTLDTSKSACAVRNPR
jgi:hypothetical protein